MIIDSHNHLGVRKGENFPVETLIEWEDAAGLDACVVTTHPEAIDNDYVAHAQERYPNRVIGFAVINPWNFSAGDELRRCFRDLDLYGLKLNPIRHGYDLDRHEIVDELFQICEEYHKPVLCHGQSDMFNMPGKFGEMAASFPNVNIIMAHMGSPDAVDTAMRVVNRHANIYVDSASVSLNVLKTALASLEPEKILMGTDAPWGRFELSMELVRRATDDEHVRKLIMGENIARLLSWKPRHS